MKALVQRAVDFDMGNFILFPGEVRVGLPNSQGPLGIELDPAESAPGMLRQLQERHIAWRDAVKASIRS